jgi:hypothetical protein
LQISTVNESDGEDIQHSSFAIFLLGIKSRYASEGFKMELTSSFREDATSFTLFVSKSAYHPQNPHVKNDLQAHKDITCIPKPPNSWILANVSFFSDTICKSALTSEIVPIMFNRDDQLNP